MDNETVNNNMSFYKYSEDGIKQRNSKLWKDINKINIDISFKERFYLYENKIEEVPICYCGNGLKFIDMINGYRKFCSRKCMFNSSDIKERRKKTCLEKYGVDNPSKSSDIKDLVKITNNKKFGVDYPLQSSEILEKNKKYFLEKYGVDNPSKLSEVRDKANITIKQKYGVEHIMFSYDIKEKNKKYFLEKYGVDNPSKLSEVRDKAMIKNNLRYGVNHVLQNPLFIEKMKITNNLRYGVEFYTQSDEYKEKLNSTIFMKNSSIINDVDYHLIKSKIDEYIIECGICNKEFTIQRQLYRNRIKNDINICLNCNPISNGISIDEKKIFSFIKNNYKGEIIENFKINKKEIDIYLPELKLGFEFNGLYWHSELNKQRSYHYDKHKFFMNRNVNIIDIWEDDWLYRQDIIKSMILNKLGKTPNRIFARKCEIKEISDNKLIREFLEKNHIQGFVGSKIKLGLFYNNELVSLMTFGNLRKSLGQKSKEGFYELLRFCNLLNTSVIGGASKLFKYFIKNHKPLEIISYSLNSYSTGYLYKKLGFNLKLETKYNYFWVKNTIKYHRFSFRKDKLIKEGYDSNLTEIEIMYQRGYFRVFDSGSKKWILKI